MHSRNCSKEAVVPNVLFLSRLGSLLWEIPALVQLPLCCRILTMWGLLCCDQSLLTESTYSMLYNWNYHFPLRSPKHSYGLMVDFTLGYLAVKSLAVFGAREARFPMDTPCTTLWEQTWLLLLSSPKKIPFSLLSREWLPKNHWEGGMDGVVSINSLVNTLPKTR